MVRLSTTVLSVILPGRSNYREKIVTGLHPSCVSTLKVYFCMWVF